MFACNVCMCACDGEVQEGDCFVVLFFFRGGEVLSCIHIKEEGGVESVLDLKKEKRHLETEH